jgi:alpha-methylacyl-CoA racemase
LINALENNVGPLSGLKVIELAGIGPGPFCAMVLADMGADVLRIERSGGSSLPIAIDPTKDVLNRGRRSVMLNLKHPQGVEAMLQLCERADVLIEGYRPGVMERLGLGPDECRRRNPKLVYGRMTGWGQEGPLAQRAGHDITYIATSGVLHMIGRAGELPVAPGGFIGDMGGGGLLLAFGLLCAIFEARNSGLGQVVDAAMVDGSSLLGAALYGLMAMGLFDADRWGVNMADTGSHFYEVYQTSDGKLVAVGALEPQFYTQLLAGLGLNADELPPQMDSASWPAMKRRFAEIFRRKTRSEWESVFEGKDACVAAVLSPREAASGAQMRARGSFTEAFGVLQPSPAPRFSRTPGAISRPPPAPGEHTDAALADWGFAPDRIRGLRQSGALG